MSRRTARTRPGDAPGRRRAEQRTNRRKDDPRHRGHARLWRLVLGPLLVLGLSVGIATGEAGAAALKVGTLTDGVWAFAFTPKVVPGANDWTCKPSAAHPRPVVLVHATMANMGFNWAALSPMLKNAGYCVFALNYGSNLLSLDQRFGGLNDIPTSAKELKAFVDKVLSSTHAAKVDLVGHSQGGMMPNYYLKRLGGASKVGTLVGLSPSNHGTTLSGVVTLGQQMGILSGFNTLGMLAAPGLIQQEVGSPFITALFKDGDTVPGPKYVVITTTKDEVVTPYTNALLSGPNVKNITIQHQCPSDTVGHIGIVYDSPALQNVMNVLGPNAPTFTPVCSGYGIGV